jgi:formamidopyrimidine-DNA glycosylase
LGVIVPELPEVETIRRGLTGLIVGKTVQGAHNYDSAKSFPNAQADVQQFLVGAQVTAVRRRAKVLLVDLSTDYTLVCHLKMTGQIVVVGASMELQPSGGVSPSSTTTSRQASFRGRGESSEFISEPSGGVSPSLRWGGGHPNDSLIRTLPDNTTRERLDFTDGTQLFFNDLRKFGWMKLYPTSEVPNMTFMQKVGPEPLESAFTGEVLYERLQRRKNTNIKAAILDQTVLAGVGNIYADESLWMVQLHPATQVKNIPPEQIESLAYAVKSVMNLSIAKGGSTDKNYVNAEGKKGSYLSFANVFRRQGQPCPRCGTTITKLRGAARGTHICPTCQKVIP